MVWGLVPVSTESLTTLSVACRRELSPFGVKVAIIEPGSFQTNIASMESFLKSLQASWDQASPEIKEIYGQEYAVACK